MIFVIILCGAAFLGSSNHANSFTLNTNRQRIRNHQSANKHYHVYSSSLALAVSLSG
jgi:ABC-type transport system involved in multi-copper enzyme maturation permease subunit